MLAQEHGEPTIAAQIEWEENVLVPENIDASAPKSECRIDGAIIETDAIIERTHPALHQFGSQQASGTNQEIGFGGDVLGVSHQASLLHHHGIAQGQLPLKTSVAGPVM